MVVNGFYKILYGGTTGSGFGILVLTNGTVCGVDEAGVAYDGNYGVDDITGAVQLHVRATVPAGAALVLGVPARNEKWSFSIDAVLGPGFASGMPTKIRTPYGAVSATFTLLRGF